MSVGSSIEEKIGDAAKFTLKQRYIIKTTCEALRTKLNWWFPKMRKKKFGSEN